MFSASPTIQNTAIHNNYNWGILANNATPILGCNNICDNGILSGEIRRYGVYNATTSVMVNAENQWWGSVSGPYHATNPAGAGNAVTDGVDFQPWRAAPREVTPPPRQRLFLPLIARN